MEASNSLHIWENICLIITGLMQTCLLYTSTKLLNSKKIAVVPGTAFGECGEGFLRISYAYSLDDLKEALGRIEEFVTELRAGMDNK